MRFEDLEIFAIVEAAILNIKGGVMTSKSFN